MNQTPHFAGFAPSIFADRRRRVLAALGGSALVVPAATPLVGPSGSELRYRPDSEFFYLTGFMEPGAVLVLRGFAEEDRAVLFARPRDAEAERWMGPRTGHTAAAEALGLDEGRSIERVDQDLPGLLDGADLVFYRMRDGNRIDRAVARALRIARRRGSRRGTGPRGMMDPGQILDDMRLLKDSSEIEAIRAAVALTVQGFRDAISTVRPGLGEWQVEAEIGGAFRGGGASGEAFATIVASGENACVLHHIQNDRMIGPNDLVLIDAGAEARMYSGDVSRTVPASGRFDAIQRDVYQIVDEARREAIEGVLPGGTLDDVHARVVRVLARGLISLGAVTGTEDEVLENRSYEPFYPHRTSHWLGLDTHDPGDYLTNGKPRALEPGMVLTIEPGLYFPRTESDGALAGIGVRIEDDVVVTHDGAAVLSGDLPTEIEEIEALVGSRYS